MSTRQVLTRIQQFRQTVAPRQIDPEARAIALRTLTEDQLEAFLQLPRFDQDHLVCVFESLYRAGHLDPDLLTAALLHDIGKHQDGRGVQFSDRTLRVVLDRVAPRLVKSLATPSRGNRVHGLMLAVHHPELGAGRARELGCSELSCWLIRHHEDVGWSDSELLAVLQKADSVC